MTNSRSPLMLNPPMGSCRIGPVSPGPLGFMDFADPNVTAVIGNTPGPLGWMDSADPTWGSRSQQGNQAPNSVVLLDKKTAVSTGGRPAAPAASASLITLALLKAAEGSNSVGYYNDLLSAMQTYAAAYAINTKLRVAHFLAQIGHESKFRIAPESGYYSPEQMREIFGCKGGKDNYDPAKDDCRKGRQRNKLWTDEDNYARKDEKLLNYVYASRLGNGDELSGDGYKYRGRGMMQLTGRNNYKSFTTDHNTKNPSDRQNFEDNPEKVAKTPYVIESAFYFWNSRSCNALADLDDLTAVTLKVNGGDNGLADRGSRLKAVKQALGL